MRLDFNASGVCVREYLSVFFAASLAVTLAIGRSRDRQPDEQKTGTPNRLIDGNRQRDWRPEHTYSSFRENVSQLAFHLNLQARKLRFQCSCLAPQYYEKGLEAEKFPHNLKIEGADKRLYN